MQSDLWQKELAQTEINMLNDQITKLLKHRSQIPTIKTNILLKMDKLFNEIMNELRFQTSFKLSVDQMAHNFSQNQ